jgi:hypothetical protein
VRFLPSVNHAGQRSGHRHATVAIGVQIFNMDGLVVWIRRAKLVHCICQQQVRDAGSQADSIDRARGRDPRNHRPRGRCRAAAAHCRAGEARQDDRAQSSEDTGRTRLRASSRRRYALSSRRPHSQSGADRRRRRRASRPPAPGARSRRKTHRRDGLSRRAER